MAAREQASVRPACYVDGPMILIGNGGKLVVNTCVSPSVCENCVRLGRDAVLIDGRRWDDERLRDRGVHCTSQL